MSDIFPWARRVRSAAGAAAPDLTPSRPVYDGKLGELYGIYLRHLALMVLTLGWSRFWGRTRLRRYLWNHFVDPGRPLRISRPRARADDRLRAGAGDARRLGRPDVAVWEYVLAREVDPGLRPRSTCSTCRSSSSAFRSPSSATMPGCATSSRARAGAASAAAWRARPGATACMATCLHLANACHGQLLTPSVSVQPRAAAHRQCPPRHAALRVRRPRRRHLRPLHRLLFPEHPGLDRGHRASRRSASRGGTSSASPPRT